MKLDRILGGIAVAAAGLYLVEARSFRVGFIADPIGPRAFPNVIGCLALAAGLWMLWRPEPQSLPTSSQLASRASRLARALGAVALLSIYASTLDPLGFLLGSTLLLTALSVLFGGGLARGVVFAFGFSAFVQLSFERLLAIPLPAGTLFFGGG